MQPPVFFSSSIRMSQNTQAGSLNIRKGDFLSVSMGLLCNNPSEWIEPEKFIPERFDSNSKYFLTPSGKKRNPYSFSPFLGGNRICVGKTFAEMISKFVMPALLTNFHWDLTVDKDDFDYPHNNMTVLYAPSVPVVIRERNLKYTVQ